MAAATPPAVRSRSVSRVPPGSGKVGQPCKGGTSSKQVRCSLVKRDELQRQWRGVQTVHLPGISVQRPLTRMLRCCGIGTALQTDEYCQRLAPGAGTTSSRQLLSTCTAKRAKQVACAAEGSAAVASASETLPTTGQLPAGGGPAEGGGGDGPALQTEGNAASTVNGWRQ